MKADIGKLLNCYFPHALWIYICYSSTRFYSGQRELPLDDVANNTSTTDNIDRELEKFLRKYFPKEINLKQIANEKAQGIEMFGPYYTHPSESNCLVM